MKSFVFSLSCLAGIITSCTAQEQGDTVNDSDCGCFLINGSKPTYYSNHLFFDFRDLAEYAGVPDLITDAEGTAAANTSSDYFSSDEWTKHWSLQSWDNRASNGEDDSDEDDGQALNGDATVLMVNSPNNVYIEQDDDSSSTFLTMRTARLNNFQTAAEFEATSLDYQFLSMRMLARAIGSPGAVAGIFTYRGAEALADVQEVDIEILTRDPRGYIQYTNQPSYTDEGGELPEATRNASVPSGSEWSDWLVHRLDWTPGRSVWYVDGQEVASIDFQTPRDPSGVNFNMWSDGGSWSGNMSLHDEALLQIQWIEMVYNTTSEEGVSRRSASPSATDVSYLGPRAGLMPRQDQVEDDQRQCSVVCSIDERSEIGAAALLWESEAGHSAMPGLVLWTAVACASLIVHMSWL